jgi:hypothetical protein
VGAFLLFMIAIVVPTHLLENPLRHARGVERDWEGPAG